MPKVLRYLVGWLTSLLAVSAYGAVVVFVLENSKATTPPVTVSMISAGVALVTGVIALLREPVLTAIRRPSLCSSFWPNDKRDCHATQFKDKNGGAFLANAHYLRLRIENAGSRSADKVEVTIEEVRQFVGSKYEIDHGFMPLRLMWSHWPDPQYESSIPPDAYRHCDLGFAVQPSPEPLRGAPHSSESGKLLFWLSTLLRQNAGRTSLLPGKYRLLLSASGKDVARRTLVLEVEWKGIWYDEIDKMLKRSILILKGAR